MIVNQQYTTVGESKLWVIGNHEWFDCTCGLGKPNALTRQCLFSRQCGWATIEGAAVTCHTEHNLLVGKQFTLELSLEPHFPSAIYDNWKWCGLRLNYCWTCLYDLKGRCFFSYYSHVKPQQTLLSLMQLASCPSRIGLRCPRPWRWTGTIHTLEIAPSWTQRLQGGRRSTCHQRWRV